MAYGISNDATAARCCSGTSGNVENDTAWKGAQKPGGKPASTMSGGATTSSVSVFSVEGIFRRDKIDVGGGDFYV